MAARVGHLPACPMRTGIPPRVVLCGCGHAPAEHGDYGVGVCWNPDNDRCIRYRPSEWLTDIRAVVDQIGYRDDYRFRVAGDVAAGGDGRVFLQLQHYRPDADTGAMAWGGGGKSYLSPHMTASEIVRRALGAAIAYEEHEVREFFRYRGARVFGPHISVDALVEVADRLDVRP
jgi:hypothetical protein